jgi:hypothetical protein
MCGFRVYPLAAALAVGEDRRPHGLRHRDRGPHERGSGVPIVNLPTKVRYLSREEGGVSHFRMGRDNLKIGWLHARLSFVAIMWLPILRMLGKAPPRQLAARSE